MARTKGALPYMTGRVFVDAAFSPQQLDAAHDMIAEIKAAFKRNLGGLEWMDDATKRLARQTLPTPSIITRARRGHAESSPSRCDLGALAILRVNLRHRLSRLSSGCATGCTQSGSQYRKSNTNI